MKLALINETNDTIVILSLKKIQESFLNEKLSF